MMMKTTKANREMLDAPLDPCSALGAEPDAGHLDEPMTLITVGRIICRSLGACTKDQKRESREKLYRHYGMPPEKNQ